MKLFLTACMALLLPTMARAQQANDSTENDTAAIFRQLELGEVQITAARKLVKQDIDKLTYDVAHDEEAKTNNTLEILRKVPMVTVDGQDNIKVKGSSSFKIYKNGHPDPSFEGSTVSQILKTLPANLIKKIEVITDPGAKYDAEGTTAILNIVMKDNVGMKGVAGGVNYAINDKGSMQPAVNLTTQLGKVTVSTNYGFSSMTKRQRKIHNTEETRYADSGDVVRSKTDSRGPVKIHFGNISASYELDSLNLFSLSAGGYYYDVGMAGTTGNSRLDSNGNTIYSYSNSVMVPRYDYYNINGRFDFQHKTHLDGEVLTLRYMGSTTRQNNNTDLTFFNMENVPFAYTGYKQRSNEKFFEHTGQIDYVRPLGKVHKIEVGAKYINRSNKSNTAMDYTDYDDSDMKSRFNHNTQVAAAYAEWRANVGKWSMRAGLRYEYSHMKATYPDGSSNGFSKNLNDWCPSASVQYKIDDANTISAKYSTNINRPGISYLNPARIETPTSITEGAPGLNSARNQQVGITFMHVDSKITFNINPAFYFSNNQIAVLQAEKVGKTWTSYGNVNRQRSFNTSAYAQINPWKGGNIYVNIDGGYTWYKNPSLDLDLSGWSGNCNFNLQQKLIWKLIVNSGVGFSFGREPNSVYAYGGNWEYHYFSLQRSFFKEDRLTLSVETFNPFERTNVYKTRTVQGDYTGLSRSFNYNQQFGIRISYRFGSLRASVKTVDRTIENTDVVGGIKQNNGGGK